MRFSNTEEMEQIKSVFETKQNDSVEAYNERWERRLRDNRTEIAEKQAQLERLTATVESFQEELDKINAEAKSKET